MNRRGPRPEAGERAGRPGGIRVVVSPVFLVLWGAMLVSATGTFFLLLTVSAELLTRNGSGLGASAVFAFQWILPVVLVHTVKRRCETPRLRRTVVAAELGGAAISLTIGVLLAQGLAVALLACFLLRGLLEAITKTARVVYTRQLFEGEALKLASYTFNNSYYLGGALGGVLGALLATRVSVTTAAAIDAATFVVSACCYLWLPRVSAPKAPPGAPGGVWGTVRTTLRGRRELMLAAIYLVLAIGILQGFHNTARTIIPIRLLRLDDAEVMQLQIVSGSAIFLGAVAVPVLISRSGAGRYLNLMGVLLAALGMGLLPQAPGKTGLYLLYFAYMFVFEFIFTTAQATIIQRCPPSSLVALTSFTNATGTALLILCTLLTGGLSDVVDFGTLALLLAAGVGCVALAAEGAARRRVRGAHRRVRGTHRRPRVAPAVGPAAGPAPTVQAEKPVPANRSVQAEKSVQAGKSETTR
ncbi:MFS transporter [Actinomadura macra]|uniref:MFS transporter n=1 Tax=Actinomadura macra TaxID=46164 RepID=UPI00082DB7AE|nr:MFS transporter [Actinomadura macra]